MVCQEKIIHNMCKVRKRHQSPENKRKFKEKHRAARNDALTLKNRINDYDRLMLSISRAWASVVLVIVSPASILASSLRSASHRELNGGDGPVVYDVLDMRKWLCRNLAICQMGDTDYLVIGRAGGVLPTTSAVDPPIPASTSSKTTVSREDLCAVMAFRASTTLKLAP